MIFNMSEDELEKEDLGIFPRGLLDILEKVESIHKSGTVGGQKVSAVLT